MSVYAAQVRTLIARLVVLIAVLLMPLGMTPAPASTHEHAMAGMVSEHCSDKAPGHNMKSGVAECTMACASALPASRNAVGEPLLIVCEPVRPDTAEPLHGLHPETATPPPKRS